jgi:hypothetical protein
MGGIEHAAQGVSAVLHERLPWQRKTQRENLALLVATMLSERSANLMSLAAALPRPSERVDMRYQWIVRVLANPLIECDAVMLPFAREVLARAQAEAGPGEPVDLILDQSRASERHQILMLALRWGGRALPLAWRVEETEGAIGFGVQKGLLDTVAAWLPEAARVCLLGDRFYGTPALIAHCQSLGWDYRLRLKNNLQTWIGSRKTTTGDLALSGARYFQDVALTAKRVGTNIGVIHDAGHAEPCEIAERFARDYRHVCRALLPQHARLFAPLGYRADVLGLQNARVRPRGQPDPIPRSVGQAHPGHGTGAVLRRLHRTVGCGPPCHAC